MERLKYLLSSRLTQVSVASLQPNSHLLVSLASTTNSIPQAQLSAVWLVPTGSASRSVCISSLLLLLCQQRFTYSWNHTDSRQNRDLRVAVWHVTHERRVVNTCTCLGRLGWQKIQLHQSRYFSARPQPCHTSTWDGPPECLYAFAGRLQFRQLTVCFVERAENSYSVREVAEESST